jgi:hypothetical protein
MIPKKQDARDNPSNLRPIKITNCLASLCERVLLISINYHLKKKKIIVNHQSGFRLYRQTKDNLFYEGKKNM